MKLRSVLALCIIVLACLLGDSHAFAAGKRVALVIGNANYGEVSPLENPRNDADGVAAALRRLGFEVHQTVDASRASMLNTLAAFTSAMKNADAALLYYSGHGVQLDDENFMLPVDFRLKSELSVRYDAIPVSTIVRDMEGSARVAIVILDACRDNPFADQLQRTLGQTRSVRTGRGLVPIKLLGSGAIIAFAAAAGRTASDGTGKNSPYTSALLAEIEQPGVEVGLVFRRIAGRVVKSTDGGQRPELLVRLTTEFYLKPKPETVAVEKLKSDLVAAVPSKPVPKPTAQPAPASRAREGQEQGGTVRTEDVRFRASQWGYYSALRPTPTTMPNAPWQPPQRRSVAETEPNNTWTKANSIQSSDVLNLAIHPRYDKDRFRFAVGSGGELQVNAGRVPSGIDLSIRLLDANGQPVGAPLLSPRPGGVLTGSFQVKEPGQYGLEVADHSNNAQSPDIIGINLRFVPQADLYESNDTIGTAAHIPQDWSAKLNILPRYDRDWYRLSVASAGQLAFQITNVPDSLNIALRVLDGDQKVIKNWSLGPRKGGDTIGAADLPRPGTYYVEIADSGDTAATIKPFNAKLAFTASPDKLEPNDARGSA